MTTPKQLATRSCSQMAGHLRRSGPSRRKRRSPVSPTCARPRRSLERRPRENPASVLLLPRARGHGRGVHEGRIHSQQRVWDRIRDSDEAAARGASSCS